MPNKEMKTIKFPGSETVYDIVDETARTQSINKQDKLIGTEVEGQNIKTVNGESLLGTGNIAVSAEDMIFSDTPVEGAITLANINVGGKDWSLGGGGGSAGGGIISVDSLPEATQEEYEKHNLYQIQDNLKFIAYLNNAFYKKVGDLQIFLRAASACSAGNNCYIFGGINNTSGALLKDIYKFDTLTNQLSKVGDLPVSLQEAPVCSVGTNCYIFGGSSTSADIIKFDTLTNQCTTINKFSFSWFSNASACSVGTNCYIFGGRNNIEIDSTTTIYKFDTLTNQLSKVGDLPSPKSSTSACAIGTNCYIFGNVLKTGSADIIKFDTLTNKCIKVGDLPEQKGRMACSAGNNCYIFGGYNSSDIIKYDPEINKAEKIGDLPSKTRNAAICSIGNNCYIFGGYDENNHRKDILQYSVPGYAYKTITSEW